MCMGEDCKKAQAIFALNLATSGNDPLGRKCIVLDLSGKGPRKEKWRTVVLRNLGSQRIFSQESSSSPSPLDRWRARAREENRRQRVQQRRILQRKKSADFATSPTHWDHLPMTMVTQSTS